MAFLYLNFIDNLKSGSRSWDDFYTASLEEQYSLLKKRMGYYAPDNFQEFISRAFPRTNQTYYISLPGFDREIRPKKRKDGTDGYLCINNIVIRPERGMMLDAVMPKNYDFIIIGDITFASVTSVMVKGIELIDSKSAKFGERPITCTAACAFGTTIIQGHQLPDYGVSGWDLKNPVLTNDVVQSICTELYPVPSPVQAKQIFSKWREYIDFRKYYLGKLSERCEEADSITVCDAYMLSKEAYRRNEETFAQYLLDDVKEFGKGEQIILSRSVGGAESFPLIRIEIRRNKKALFSDTIGKNGKGKPRFEVNLQRFTRDAMKLSPVPPKFDDKGNMRGIRTYTLGERYLFAFVDVEPDLTPLEKAYEKSFSAACAEIDERYNAIIENAVKKYVAEITKSLEQKYAKMLEDYKKSLAASLEKDIAGGNDKEFKKAIRELEKKVKDEEITEEEKEQSIRQLYIQRNIKLAEAKAKSLGIQMQSELDRMKKAKEQQLRLQYRDAISHDKEIKKAELQTELAAKKAEKIENETIRSYFIYFRPEDAIDKPADIEKDLEAVGVKYLMFDNRAEGAKIERQEKALNSLLGGYVRNPFLPTYLFSPETLAQTTRDAGEEIDWCLESLNDRQRLAVRRALASESIFLLQGPPGTGKTQVIAEICAQLAKKGKKVLISSETHKAIDNVFERLPKIPEIRPLRLIPSQNGKETNYSPEKLVDNFYANICGNLEKQIVRYTNFGETKEKFDEEMKELRHSYDRLLQLEKANAKAESERQQLAESISALSTELAELRSALGLIREEKDEYRRTVKYIESFRFVHEGVKDKYIVAFADKCQELLNEYKCLKELDIAKLGELMSVDISVIEKELSMLLSEETLVSLKKKQIDLRRMLSDLRDPDTDEAPMPGEPNYEEYKKLQGELKEVVNQIKEAESNSSSNISDGVIFSLLPSALQDRDALRWLVDEIKSFRIKVQKAVADIKAEITIESDKNRISEDSTLQAINDKQLEISDKKHRYEELCEDDGIAEYSELNSLLKQKITRFFNDFSIVSEYKDFEEAFEIIKKEWDKLEHDFKRTERENAIKIPLFREIVKYLSQDEILEEDRQAYTRELYDNANIFGITCTSRDRFTKSQLTELEKYGIGTVDIRTQGIDVVIIDEVSKSSFLDLLIPILYGKTVILVGDHRQLPPMYDLRHLRAADFEGLDEKYIDAEKNVKFTELYEECFFKTLYERVPDDFRVMLNKQYRCHSHIMEVFNHFYGGKQNGLMIGKAQQDDEKEHRLTVKINGSTVIDPSHHIYFVDCDQFESSAYEGSTSKVNEQEAEVCVELLKAIDKASLELVKASKIRLDEQKRIDERPSVGVICTYGDQAGLIKKKRKGKQFNGFSSKQDERLIISTVDDFQGDERDVIILSMVRNPRPGAKFDATFIKQFERINVAMSRARKLLIVVGSKKFLSENGIIDLPDLSGKKALDKINFPVYREIIDTINFRGRILSANDIVGE